MNYAGTTEVLQIGYIVLPYLKFHNIAVFALCCLLLYIFVYIVQFSRCRPSNLLQGQIETLTRVNASIQSRIFMEVFSAYSLFQKRVSGGPKWTRTTDLTIISRAL